MSEDSKKEFTKYDNINLENPQQSERTSTGQDKGTQPENKDTNDSLDESPWQDRARVNVDPDEKSARTISGIENELEETVFEKESPNQGDPNVNREEIKKDMEEREGWIRGDESILRGR